MDTLPNGVFPTMITPFIADGSAIDWPVLALVHRALQACVIAYVVLSLALGNTWADWSTPEGRFNAWIGPTAVSAVWQGVPG